MIKHLIHVVGSLFLALAICILLTKLYLMHEGWMKEMKDGEQIMSLLISLFGALSERNVMCDLRKQCAAITFGITN